MIASPVVPAFVAEQWRAQAFHKLRARSHDPVLWLLQLGLPWSMVSEVEGTRPLCRSTVIVVSAFLSWGSETGGNAGESVSVH